VQLYLHGGCVNFWGGELTGDELLSTRLPEEIITHVSLTAGISVWIPVDTNPLSVCSIDGILMGDDALSIGDSGGTLTADGSISTHFLSGTLTDDPLCTCSTDRILGEDVSLLT
jgi:hypothetical protein